MKMQLCTMAVLATAGLAVSAQAEIQITEWMYDGDAEFVELTNVGIAPINMTGWTMTDSQGIPGGTFSLTGFGIVLPGESVIITDATAAAFRANWGLAPTVDVLGELGGAGGSNNLGRNDSIIIYDPLADIVDRLDYGDQNFPGSVRTQERSGNPITLAAVGANAPLQWQLAVVGDAYGSWQALSGDIGNPGVFNLIPSPGALALLALAGVVGSRRRRH